MTVMRECCANVFSRCAATCYLFVCAQNEVNSILFIFSNKCCKKFLSVDVILKIIHSSIRPAQKGRGPPVIAPIHLHCQSAPGLNAILTAPQLRQSLQHVKIMFTQVAYRSANSGSTHFEIVRPIFELLMIFLTIR